jgi:hypothetical protein
MRYWKRNWAVTEAEFSTRFVLPRFCQANSVGGRRKSAGMAELADAADSKSAEGNLVGVRPPLPAPTKSVLYQINASLDAFFCAQTVPKLRRTLLVSLDLMTIGVSRRFGLVNRDRCLLEAQISIRVFRCARCVRLRITPRRL